MTSKRVFLFPGQGSQAVGMLGDWVEHPVAKETFAEASEALGYDLAELIQNGPAEELNKTFVAQPALLATSVALYRIYLAAGGAKPDFMAGHSLGEYSALVCAGAVDFADGIKLVEQRGRYMQDAVPPGTGGMAAIIGLTAEQVVACCDQAANGDVVSAVNFNSPIQTVIAGQADAVTRASEACKEAGAKRVVPLPVSVPSHCALMQPAADKLGETLKQVNVSAPDVVVVNNVDVATESAADAIQSALVRQLFSPVRWTETVTWLADQGVTEAFEVGPGAVLTGLIKRAEKRMTIKAINTAEGSESIAAE
ncbi:malonyl CoA-acyl carrier protein transacylase [Neiella marina]|uniref:Malonyl CoA-acyl carrier protein transacylase n=1 Tax=Neiella marina TaxID=508461 RepID=A0A8J2XP79_9GAMM|nr:ACP S-malonyltransferase [Neiella marina]GGA86960.1 malonyl CoA-acyl carrier protein transacylase [Neiella marina]